MKSRFIAVLLLAFAGLAACSPGSLLPGQKDPPRLFELTPKSTFDPDLPQVDWQLLVETPIAAAGVDTPRIALKRTPTTMDYFARAEWSDRAPALVQTLMVESFENTDRIISVGRESLALRADYTLKVELREFQAEYYDTTSADSLSGPPRVNVRINLKLVKMPERVIIAGSTFGREIDASSNKLDDIVLAFNDALGKVLKRAVAWTLETGHANRAAAAS